jgi:hypothetical protein
VVQPVSPVEKSKNVVSQKPNCGTSNKPRSIFLFIVIRTADLLRHDQIWRNFIIYTINDKNLSTILFKEKEAFILSQGCPSTFKGRGEFFIG